VPVQAVEQGSASTAAAGQIDALVTVFLGLSVTNAAAITGADAESDVDLTARAQEQVGSLSPNGPLDAYNFFAKGAKRASDASAIGVTRVRATPDGAGGVAVLVATAVGGITGTQSDATTDLGAVHLAVETNAVPLGITLTTTSATTLVVAVTATLWIDERLADSDAAVTARVLAQLTALMATMPIGGVVVAPAAGTLYIQAIEAAMSAAVVGSLVDLELASPAADTALATTSAVVMGALDLAIVRVAV